MGAQKFKFVLGKVEQGEGVGLDLCEFLINLWKLSVEILHAGFNLGLALSSLSPTG